MATGLDVHGLAVRARAANGADAEEAAKRLSALCAAPDELAGHGAAERCADAIGALAEAASLAGEKGENSHAAALALAGLQAQNLFHLEGGACVCLCDAAAELPERTADLMVGAAASWVIHAGDFGAEAHAQTSREAARALVCFAALIPAAVGRQAEAWAEQAVRLAGSDAPSQLADAFAAAVCAAASVGALTSHRDEVTIGGGSAGSNGTGSSNGVIRQVKSAEGRQQLISTVQNLVAQGEVARAMRLWRMNVSMLDASILRNPDLLNPLLKPMLGVLMSKRAAERVEGQRAWREFVRALARSGCVRHFKHLKLGAQPLPRAINGIESDGAVAQTAMSTWEELVRSVAPRELLAPGDNARVAWGCVVDKVLKVSVWKAPPRPYTADALAGASRGLACLLALLKHIDGGRTRGGDPAASVGPAVYLFDTEPNTEPNTQGFPTTSEGTVASMDRSPARRDSAQHPGELHEGAEQDWEQHMLERVETLARVLDAAFQHCLAAPRADADSLQVAAAQCWQLLCKCVGKALIGAGGAHADMTLPAVDALLATATRSGAAAGGPYLVSELLLGLEPALARGALDVMARTTHGDCEEARPILETLMALWSAEVRAPSPRWWVRQGHSDHKDVCVEAFSSVRARFSEGTFRERQLSALCVGLTEAADVSVCIPAWIALAQRVGAELESTADDLAAARLSSHDEAHATLFPGLVDVLSWPFEHAVYRKKPETLAGDRGESLMATWLEMAVATVRATGVIPAPLLHTARAALCERLSRVSAEATLACEGIDGNIETLALAWRGDGVLNALADAVARLATTPDLDDGPTTPLNQSPLRGPRGHSQRDGKGVDANPSQHNVAHSSRFHIARVVSELLDASAAPLLAADSRSVPMAVPSLLVASKYLVRNCRTERSLNLVAGEVARGLTHWINLSCNLQAKIVAALEQAVIALFESVSQLHQQTSEGMCEFVAQVAPLLRAHAVQEIAPQPVRAFCKLALDRAQGLSKELCSLVGSIGAPVSPARPLGLGRTTVDGGPRSPWMAPAPERADGNPHRTQVPSKLRRLAFTGGAGERVGFLDADTMGSTEPGTDATDATPLPELNGSHKDGAHEEEAVAGVIDARADADACAGDDGADRAAGRWDAAVDLDGHEPTARNATIPPTRPIAGAGTAQEDGTPRIGSSAEKNTCAQAPIISSSDVFATQQVPNSTPSQAGAGSGSAAVPQAVAHAGGAAKAPETAAEVAAQVLPPLVATPAVVVPDMAAPAAAVPEVAAAVALVPAGANPDETAPTEAPVAVSVPRSILDSARAPNDNPTRDSSACAPSSVGPSSMCMEPTLAAMADLGAPLDAENEEPQREANEGACCSVDLAPRSSRPAAEGTKAEALARLDEDMEAPTPQQAQAPAASKRVVARAPGAKRGSAMLAAALAPEGSRERQGKRQKRAKMAQDQLPPVPGRASKAPPSGPARMCTTTVTTSLGATEELEKAVAAVEAAASVVLAENENGVKRGRQLTALLPRLLSVATRLSAAATTAHIAEAQHAGAKV